MGLLTMHRPGLQAQNANRDIPACQRLAASLLVIGNPGFQSWRQEEKLIENVYRSELVRHRLHRRHVQPEAPRASPSKLRQHLSGAVGYFAWPSRDYSSRHRRRRKAGAQPQRKPSWLCKECGSSARVWYRQGGPSLARKRFFDQKGLT